MSRPDTDRPESPRRDTYHHGDLRRALLDATLRLVEENGPQGFTLRGAARAAGVTPGASYHHFEDKEALLAAVAEEGFELFRGALEAAARRPATSPQERARNVGVGYVLFAVEHPTRFRIMVGYGVQSRLHKGGLGNVAVSTYQLVHAVLVEGLKDRSSEPVSEAEVLGWWSVVHGLAFLAIDGHLGALGKSPKRIENIVRRVIAALDVRGR
jgi:AcrR family transcriptional regulator